MMSPLEMPEIEPFHYVESPWIKKPAGFYEVPGAGQVTGSGSDAGTEDAEAARNGEEVLNGQDHEEWMRLLAEESSRAEERGYGKGMEAGLSFTREETQKERKAERELLTAKVAALTESFAEAREGYLHWLELESVKLALAIAARILRREAQMDSLLLTGAVRVALGQLAASTSVRLRVPAEDQAMWEEAMRLMPGLAMRPNVIGDPEMKLGECRMETELGSADLGLWAQLKEIERGFFDRVRPVHSAGHDASLEGKSSGR
jgi:flagellar biosynthesis/type III secretory pathway protein FliH